MVVPARGGSRGIPGKNIKPLAGRPLIAWVLRAGVAVPAIDRIVVSTDDDRIAAAAQAVRADAGGDGVPIVPFRRSPETATDTASTESALREVAEQIPCRTLILVQATSPLLTAADLEGALRRYHDSGADSLVSVVRQHRFLWQTDAEGWAQPVNYDPGARPRRQDFDGLLVENGAIYIFDRDGFLATGHRLFGRMVAYEMAPESYVELDEPGDWPVVEALLTRRAAGPGAASTSLEADPRLAGIRLVLSDIDGVLTDAGMYYGEQGDELKKFCTYDGQGLALLREAGLPVGLITREDRALNARRAEKMGVAFLEQGARDKVAVAAAHLERLGIDWSETAYLGDDVHDAGLLARVGLAVVPAGAMAPARAVAHHVLQRRGGEGCLRELADAILAARAGRSGGGSGAGVAGQPEGGLRDRFRD